jgi:sugar phosphate isomerase/epimerase
MSEMGISRRGLLAGLGGAAAAGVLVEALPAAAGGGAARTDPPFHLGTVTYNVPKDWDLPTLLKVLKQVGMTGVEFRTTHAHGVEPALSPDRRAEVKRLCAEAGMKQVSLGTVCEFQSPDPAVVRRNVESCREFVRLAKDIGARGIKVRPNGLPKEVPVDKTLEQIGRALRECGDMAADAGVEIWVEVHGGGTAEPANCRKIMDHCGHQAVGLTWNSNGTDLKNGSVREGFELLRPFIRCCHINNLWGDYPYRELFGLLRQTGFTGYTLCEVATPIKAEDGVLFFQCYQGLWRELARA